MIRDKEITYIFPYFGSILKLVKRALLKSVRSVMSWHGGSNLSTSANGNADLMVA